MNTLEIIGFTTGLLYLWLEYRASIYLWIVGIIMPVIGLFVYFQAGLYADFAMNIYYTFIAVYGFLVWKLTGKSVKGEGRGEKGKELPIIHTPKTLIAPLICISAALWLGIWWLLVSFTNSTVPVADAFTTALSIVAYWMLAHKHAEQWLVWLVVDAVCVVLYIYKGIPFYGILYAAYTVIAWFGYKKWLRMMRGRSLSRPVKAAAESDNYSPSSYREALQKIGVVISFTRGVSMRPLIWQGRHNVAIVPVDEPKLGDLLLFEQMRRGETACILHRLVKIDGDIFVTRGDNCLGCEYIRREDIIGKVEAIYRTGGWRPWFALGGEEISVHDGRYLRYVRIWNALWPVRKIIYQARGVAARIYHFLKEKFGGLGKKN